MREITSLDELKTIELSIMKKVHQFCEEQGIWYVLTYGTLIGAVRHEGFIPWDVNCTPCQGQFQRCESVPLDGYRFYYP